jgi:hypothetical protein
MAVPVPVILYGAMKQVAATVRANLLPEYDGLFCDLNFICYQLGLAKL